GADRTLVFSPSFLIFQMEGGAEGVAGLVDQAAAAAVAPLAGVVGVGAAVRLLAGDPEDGAPGLRDQPPRLLNVGAVHPVLGIVQPDPGAGEGIQRAIGLRRRPGQSLLTPASV